MLKYAVDFRFSAFSCFEASVAMQKQADAFRGQSVSLAWTSCAPGRKRVVEPNSFPVESHLDMLKPLESPPYTPIT